MSWDAMLSAGLIGTFFTVIANIFIAVYKTWRQKSVVTAVIASRSSTENQKAINDQFEVFMKSSEEYRDELRKDLDKLKEDHGILQNKYHSEISEMKQFYEKELAILRQRVATLTAEVVSYRQENGALHLLLQQRGIEVPSWVIQNKETEK